MRKIRIYFLREQSFFTLVAQLCICLINVFQFDASWHSSTKTPLVSFGCKKATSLLSAPFFGNPGKTVNPSCFSRSIYAARSSTEKAI